LTSAISVALASVSVTTITTVAAVAVAWPSVGVAAVPFTVVAAWRRAVFVSLVVCLYLVEEFIDKLLRLGYTFGTRSSNVEIHGLVALLAGLGLHETRATALDLYLAAGLLLDILDVVATAADDLCSQVKAADWFKTYGDFLFWPFAL
jgi:hypothetical protein